MHYLEISACRMYEIDGVDHGVEDDEAEFWGVYRRPEIMPYDPDPEAYAEWLADFPTRAEAEALVALLMALSPGYDTHDIDGFDLWFEDVWNDDYNPNDPGSERGWRTFDVSVDRCVASLQSVEHSGDVQGAIPVPQNILDRLVSRARALGYDL
jgi:hypothetical protein